jgi:hypothetical protein
MNTTISIIDGCNLFDKISIIDQTQILKLENQVSDIMISYLHSIDKPRFISYDTFLKQLDDKNKKIVEDLVKKVNEITEFSNTDISTFYSMNFFDSFKRSINYAKNKGEQIPLFIDIGDEKYLSYSDF